MLKIVGTALAAAAVLASAASAAPATIIRSDVTVAFADLDLSTENGARELLTRIDSAASQACGGSAFFYSSYSIAPNWAEKEFNTCKTNAVGTAVKSLPFPQVQKLSATAVSPLRVAGK